MTHELDTFINPATRKTIKVQNHMISLPSPVYLRLSKLAETLKISRGAAVEALLNYIDDDEVAQA